MFTACVRCPGEVLKTVLRLCASVDVNPGYTGAARVRGAPRTGRAPGRAECRCPVVCFTQ